MDCSNFDNYYIEKKKIKEKTDLMTSVFIVDLTNQLLLTIDLA